MYFLTQVLVLIFLILTLINAENKENEENEEARFWHRRKKPCRRSESSTRTFFAVLLGDLVVNQPAPLSYEGPCNYEGVKPPLLGSHGSRPPLLGSHGSGSKPPSLGSGSGSRPPLFGGLGMRPPLFGGLGMRPPLFGGGGGGGGLLQSFGSLFNTNGVRPTLEVNTDNYKPIFEDIPEDEVTEDYRPGIVGGSSQDIAGVMQDLTNFRPGNVVNRINRQFDKYFINPIVDLFYK